MLCGCAAQIEPHWPIRVSSESISPLQLIVRRPFPGDMIMKVEQQNGKVVITTPERDEFGEINFCDRVLTLNTARRIRDEITAAIKVCESMAGFENGVHVGTD